MKVILLQDVAKIGKRSEVVEVPHGYALNKLIPKGLAETATAASKKRIEKMQAEAEASNAGEETAFESAAKSLNENKLKIAAEVNEKGHTFKAVSEAEIVSSAEDAGVTIAEAMVVIAEPIKEAGDHQLTLVRGKVKHTFTIEVVKK